MPRSRLHFMRFSRRVIGVLQVTLLLLIAPTIHCQYQDGDIRLVGGSYQWEGRVEIYLSGTWGTITDSDWSSDDAQVVCRKLGYFKPGATAHSAAYFGEGRGTIHWNSVECSGSEYSLIDCDAENTGTRSLDVGVKCQPDDGSYREGDIRLVGGSYNWEGRVEIYLSGVWGTVSDSSWTTADTLVVCSQLGHSASGGFPRACCADYGQGSGAVHIHDVTCSGSEPNITSCTSQFNSIAGRSHSDDVGVECQKGGETREGNIRLVGGTHNWVGRVEIYISGVWGTISDDIAGGSTFASAKVVCRQLGFNTYIISSSCCATYGEGSGPIHVDNLACLDTQYRVTDCLYDKDTTEDSHSDDWSVFCHRDGPEPGDVRVGSTINEGSVQVFMSGYWVPVATSCVNWTLANAKVVCRQLGYSLTDIVVYSAGHFGRGYGPETIDNVACTGLETTLLSCPHNKSSLSSYNAAAMKCQRVTDCTDGDVRLAGGGDEMEGRVEICSSSRWGTVCGSQWTDNHTAVVCRHLGFSDEEGDLSFYSSEKFGEGAGPILMDFVNCSGSEPRLWNRCNHYTHYHGCNHSGDVGVRCQPVSCSDGQIRLMEGSQSTGRVEICFNQRWGTIVDDLWDSVDTSVACQEMGFTYSDTYHCCASYRRGGGPIYWTNVQCTGEESRLSQCDHDNDTQMKTHSEDVAITCSSAPCADGEVRLVEGESEWEGRLEVCLSQRWGTVSSDEWSHTNTHVICNDLGYDFSDKVNTSIPQSLSKPVFLHNVVCSKSDLTLLECSFTKYSGNNNNVQDIVINCKLPSCSDGDLKLVGGDSEREGRLEVCFNQRWGTVNGDGWSSIDTQVACRQLGYSTSDVSFSVSQRKRLSASLPVHVTLVGCYRSDEKLTDCAYDMYTSSSDSMDVSVICGSSENSSSDPMDCDSNESNLNALSMASLSMAVVSVLAIFVVFVVIIVAFFVRKRKENCNVRSQKSGTLGMTECTTRSTEMKETYSANISYNHENFMFPNDKNIDSESDTPMANYEDVEAPTPPVVETVTKQHTRSKPTPKKPVAAPTMEVQDANDFQNPRQPVKKAPVVAPQFQGNFHNPVGSSSSEDIYEILD